MNNVAFMGSEVTHFVLSYFVLKQREGERVQTAAEIPPSPCPELQSKCAISLAVLCFITGQWEPEGIRALIQPGLFSTPRTTYTPITVLQLTPETLPQSLQLQQDIDHRTVVRSSASEHRGTMGHSVTKLYLQFLCWNGDCFYLSILLCFLWECHQLPVTPQLFTW